MKLLSVFTILTAVLALGRAVVSLLYRTFSSNKLIRTLLLLLYRITFHHVETAHTVILGGTLEYQVQWYELHSYHC